MLTQIKNILKHNKYIRKLYILIFGYKVRKNFDAAWYVETYPDVKRTNADPLLHYLRYGKKENKYISEKDFIAKNINEFWYFTKYQDAFLSGLSALQHYLAIGKDKGYAISFDEDMKKSVRFSFVTEVNHLKSIPAISQKCRQYKSTRSLQKIRKVVFSAIAGGYESIRIPSFIDPNFDYVLFTDKPSPDTGVWKIRPIPYWNSEQTRITRYVKLHPHFLFSDIDIAIWIDHNVLIKKNFSSIVDDFIKSGLPIATYYHPERSNIYEEAEECLKRKLDNPETIKRQISIYREKGFSHDDLPDTAIMMFNMKHKSLRQILNNWWSDLDKYSYRDQLSFNPAIAQANEKYYPLAQKGISPHNSNKYFSYSLHDHNNGVSRCITESFCKNWINPWAGESFSMHKSAKIPHAQELVIDVCIYACGELQSIKTCLKSLFSSSKIYNKIIIIDDYSENDIQNYLYEISKYKKKINLIRNKSPFGYTKSINKAIRTSEADFIILLSSNMIVTENWAEKMAVAILESEGAEIVGPLSNVAGYQSIPSLLSAGDDTTINLLPSEISPHNLNDLCEIWAADSYYPRVPLVHSSCLGMTRTVIKKLTGFDEFNFPHSYGAIDDFSFRASNAGIDKIIATNTYIYSQSSVLSERDFQIMRESSKKLLELYGESRILRAHNTMKGNPTLAEMRKRMQFVYDSYINQHF